ncbi:TSC22 domain family protein 2 isoform X2 [Spea bombifrons]|uniref:TSC22 domain family protein 2 isoform X2 n=1 Tax=Spea bombifrons TaxID=233779 RepID=UPI002349F9A2|nr:TSC22 domain family protein 2 isoform X2 [Spea bombifrons]
MSKMPAKKKSCFQITSVTTAQATSSITEDTESLDDPDESRTEDVSSEIFDVSRATDYGPEDVVERSSSEETLNNVGEAETPGTMSPNVPHESFGIAGTVIGVGGGAVTRSSGQVATGGPSGQLSAPHTPTALPGVATPTSAPHVTSQPAASSTATCSSRFRVIKLDHGSGEPYRRGRWTCMEYYDRDSDSTLISRTGDTIRHTSTIDHSVDRDSGLGATGGSVVASAVHIGYAPESLADSPLTAVSQLPSSEKMNQPSQQQHFVIGQQPIGGAVSQGAAQPMYPGAAVTTQQMMVQQSQSHVSPQNIVQGGHNGKGTVPQNVPVTITQQQASVSVSQPQQFAFSQVQPGHVMSTQSSAQPEYVQHVTVMQSQGTSQKATTASVITSTGSPSSLPGQHLQAGGAQLMGLLPKTSESLSQSSGLIQSGQAPQTLPVHMQPPGTAVQTNVSSVGVVQHKTSQQQAGGSSHVSSIPGGHLAMPPGMQNVPVAVPSSVPTASAAPVSMPIAPSTFAQSPLTSHTPVSRSSSLIPPVGLPAMQGMANVHASLPQTNINLFQTQSLTGQIDDRRKSEPLPQPSVSLISEKSFVKVPITDALANPLHLPVFGLPIPVDGDDDSASSANVVAIDNKIEQAMDLVKSHLMYAVREEVEVLKEQIKELIEKNSTLERENALLKSLSNNDQLSQLSTQVGLNSCQQQPPVTTAPLTAPQIAHPTQQPNVSSA